jgi:hypothetical protein
MFLFSKIISLLSKTLILHTRLFNSKSQVAKKQQHKKISNYNQLIHNIPVNHNNREVLKHNKRKRYHLRREKF